MYIFDGNAVVINIRGEAGNKKAKYPSILKAAIVFTLVLFICFSTMTYCVFREMSQPIFTMSLVPINGLIIFIFICVCINALTSYPVQILAAFDIIEKIDIFKYDSNHSPAFNTFKKLALRSAIITATTLICMAVKTFTDFINIAGAIGSATVSFILP